MFRIKCSFTKDRYFFIDVKDLPESICFNSPKGLTFDSCFTSIEVERLVD